jgi:hypothetical protein
MEDRPMYLGLIHIVNAHEHRYPVEHVDGEQHSGVLSQVMHWLSKIFRGRQNELDGKPGKQK